MTLGQAIEPIVLVEDDPDDAFFVRRSLQAARIRNQLLVFESATQARGHFKSIATAAERPVLVIIDVHLPGGESGIDFLRWLRSQPSQVGATPAMMLTASERPEDREDSSLLGAMLYLRKPVTEETLTSAVQTLGFVIVTSRFSEKVGFRIIERRSL